MAQGARDMRVGKVPPLPYNVTVCVAWYIVYARRCAGKTRSTCSAAGLPFVYRTHRMHVGVSPWEFASHDAPHRIPQWTCDPSTSPRRQKSAQRNHLSAPT